MKINEYIDHTLLKADATEGQIAELCDQARQYHFASVCVNGCWAEFAASRLKGTGVEVCCVVGFPLGAMATPAKAFEAAEAVHSGADEIDMVMNIGAAKGQDWDYVTKDIATVVAAVKGKTVKVIIEACLLSDAEKVEACRCAMKAKAAFVKTSTGFSKSGAKAEDVRLMKETVGTALKVKAAGGIHTLADCRAMIAAGAERIGASAGTAIMSEYEKAGE